MMEGSPSPPRRLRLKTNKAKSDEATGMSALTYLITYL